MERAREGRYIYTSLLTLSTVPSVFTMQIVKYTFINVVLVLLVVKLLRTQFHTLLRRVTRQYVIEDLITNSSKCSSHSESYVSLLLTVLLGSWTNDCMELSNCQTVN